MYLILGGSVLDKIEVQINNKKYIVMDGLRYTETDEWAMLEEGNRVKVGITDYAQKELRDIIGVELPEINTEVGKGDVIATLESVKATGDVYAPVSGKIVKVNEKLLDEPEILNTDPYGDGWIVVIEIKDRGEYNKLMTPQQYIEHIKKRKH